MKNESKSNGRPWEDHGPKVLKSIPLSDIDDTDKRFQFRFRSSRAELGKSLAEEGQLDPIKIMPGDGLWVILDGFCRCAEAKRLGWQEIQVLIYPILSKREAKKISWACNIERVNLSPAERANAMLVARNEDGLTLKEVAKLFRRSVRQVSRYLELPEKLREFIDGTTVTMAHVRALKDDLDHLTREDVEQLMEWTKQTDASSKELKAKVKREFGDRRGKRRAFGNVVKGCVRFYSTKLVPDSPPLDRAVARAFLMSAIREIGTWSRSSEIESESKTD